MISRKRFLQALTALGLLTLTSPLGIVPSLADSAKQASAEFPFKKKKIEILESEMAYVDTGTGPVVLFLHGNPTSSYLWRNIIPYVSDDHRAIAVDLIGMGGSGKPDIDYTFSDHARYLDAFIQKLDLKDITLVMHDWGSVLGMRYARLNPDNVKAMSFMEAGIPPALPAPSLEAMGSQNEQLFGALRTPGQGEKMVLENNFFVEEVLGKIAVLTPLRKEILDHYRAPFPTPESRKPTLVWPRQIPIGGEPKDTAEVITKNGDWLYSTDIPKLMFTVEPGALMPPAVVEYVKANTSNLSTIALGKGIHFIQEDHPDAIGQALSTWLSGIKR